MTNIIWYVLGFTSLFGLVWSFTRGKNVVWGGATLGVIIALIWCSVRFFIDESFNWILFLKILIVVTNIGLLIELLGKSKQTVSDPENDEDEIKKRIKQLEKDQATLIKKQKKAIDKMDKLTGRK